MNLYITFELLPKNEFNKLNKAEKKKYLIHYQTVINEIRMRIIYAENFHPSKLGYYNFLLTDLLNSAPLQIK